MENLWWDKMPQARSFIEKFQNLLLADHSVLLVLPDNTPWRDYLRELLKAVVDKSERNLRIVDHIEGRLGAFFLDKFCQNSTAANYRPGRISEAGFLAGENELVLNNQVVWIKNIEPKQQKDLLKFVSDYHHYSPPESRRGIFVLEFDKDFNIPNGLYNLSPLICSNEIKDYDCYVFCSLLATKTECKEYLRQYLAEFVFRICGKDLEFCEKCIDYGERFLDAPQEYLQRIIRYQVNSCGEKFRCFHLADCDIKMWEAQIRTVFLKLEQFRSYFIKKHEKCLSDIVYAQRIKDSIGQVIDDVHNLELGNLSFIVGTNFLLQREVGPSELELLQIYKNARNDLAHLRPIPYDMAKKILGKNF